MIGTEQTSIEYAVAENTDKVCMADYCTTCEAIQYYATQIWEASPFFLGCITVLIIFKGASIFREKKTRKRY